MELTLAVFDMAGTTVYDGDAVHDHLAMALATQGVIADRDEINAVMGIPKPVAIREILESRSRYTPGYVDAVYDKFRESMLTHYLRSPEVRPMDGAEETFAVLRSAGIKVALDTGFSRTIAEAIVARFGWLHHDLIDILVTSDDVPRGRPWPDMISLAMRQIGTTDPKTVAKIGDTPSDLQEGTNACCGWVIGVTNGSHTAEQLSVYPHTALVASVADVPASLVSPARREM